MIKASEAERSNKVFFFLTQMSLHTSNTSRADDIDTLLDKTHIYTLAQTTEILREVVYVSQMQDEWGSRRKLTLTQS